MITLSVKNNAIANHFDEIEKEIANILHGDIERMVNSRMGALSKDVVSISGDIMKGMKISAKISKDIDLEDIAGEKKIEAAVIDALDYNYSSALDRAAAIVSARHPEDYL